MEEANPIDVLKRSVDTIKAEVDAIQIALTGQKRPWYYDISTLISTLALLFSFGTTYVSFKKSQQQDVENLRSELRGLLQRMAELPKVNADIIAKYSASPDVIANLGGYISQENSFLAIQAAEIAKQLPSNKVSAVEYYAIAIALGNSYKLDEERKFLALAGDAASARDFNTEISVLRAGAYLAFVSGNPEEGRVGYQRALSIFTKYPSFDDYTRKATHINSEIGWAYAEASIGSTLEDQHVANAETILATMPPSPGADQLRAQVQQTRDRLRRGRAALSPSGDLLPTSQPQGASLPPFQRK